MVSRENLTYIRVTFLIALLQKRHVPDPDPIIYYNVPYTVHRYRIRPDPDPKHLSLQTKGIYVNSQ
jgi:hypothetical protein